MCVPRFFLYMYMCDCLSECGRRLGNPVDCQAGMLLIFELRVRRYEEANPRRLLPVNICGRWLRRHVSQGGWWSFFFASADHPGSQLQEGGRGRSTCWWSFVEIYLDSL